MPNVIKVGLDAKKPGQSVQSVDLSTGIVTETITDYYVVQFDAAVSDKTLCYGATDGVHTIPSPLQAYNSNSGSPVVIRVMPMLDPQSAGKVWRVQVDYSNALKYAGETGRFDVKIELDGIPVTESYYFDLDGNQVTNSAGQNFSNQPNRTYEDESVRVSFKTKTFDEEAASALRQQINSGNVTITCAALNYSRTFPAGTLRLDNLRTSPTSQAGQIAYWDVQLNFTHRDPVQAPSNCKTPGGTTVSGLISTLEYDLIVDQGFAYIDGGTTKLVPFQDKDGNPTNSPGLLNGAGGAVYPNSSTVTQSPNDAHYLAFRKASRGDFSILFTGIS